jgi:acetylornithine/succinyldiaminopimelate/putrescine aminotransferase
VESGFLMNCTQENVLRFLPPLIVDRRHVDELLAGLRPLLLSFTAKTKEVQA